MQFGSPIDRRKVLPLVAGTQWNQMLELNRMAFSERLPRNSESRAMAVAFRMLRRHRPDIKWILSFSDAAQCGDGAIYRAAGFVLTGIKPNGQILEMPDGTRIAKLSLDSPAYTGADGTLGSRRAIEAGARLLQGYQLRYIYFTDKAWLAQLQVPVIPFDKIPADARMYRGVRQPIEGARQPSGTGGADPTLALHREKPDAD